MEDDKHQGVDNGGADCEFKLRSYQQEMLEESLKRNVIVAMDTGSGKTHIAVARMRAELERTENSGKLIWFVAPSVALSEQHYIRFWQLLPAYQVKLLVGSDKLDKWTDQWHWDTILANVDVVIGTPRVLEEALEHGFVSLTKISLLVFDEAHHCVGDHPMAGIMRNFYHSGRLTNTPKSRILGLTASPVYGASADSLASIEAIMDSRVITPQKHRSELTEYVHPPSIVPIVFGQDNDVALGPICLSVNQAFAAYDLMADPYVKELLDSGSDSSALAKVMMKRKTYCSDQLRVLATRAKTLTEQLGISMAELYTNDCMRLFLESVDSESHLIPEITNGERLHLASIFTSITQDTGPFPSLQAPKAPFHLSAKIKKLVDILVDSYSPNLNGIVFVEQRAVAIALANLVERVPELQDKYNAGTFLGTSTSAKRKSNIADMSDLKRQQADLESFRQGSKNLMIATNVLEEGIDISACNVVISYDLPKNLVSFVQRRGRARRRESKYIMFLPENDTRVNSSKWQVLEGKMKEAYKDDQRQSAEMYEETDEDKAADDAMLVRKKHRIEVTGALLTAKNAKAHLFHFCSTGLQASKHIDLHPEYRLHQDELTKLFTAEVNLPVYVHASVRSARSTDSWQTERAAVLDASFNAYMQLYHNGLINDNFLPLAKDYAPPTGEHRNQRKLLQVAERKSSWHDLAARAQTMDWQACFIDLKLEGETVASMAMWLPSKVPNMAPVDLYWNESTAYQASFVQSRSSTCAAESMMFQPQTKALLESVHGTRMDSRDDFVVLFSPMSGGNTANGESEVLGTAPSLSNWAQVQSPATGQYLVKSRGREGEAFISQYVKSPQIEATVDPGDALPEAAYGDAVVRKFPRRKDFLHPVAHSTNASEAYVRLHSFPGRQCIVNPLPLSSAIFAAFVPSILHRLDIALLAQDICSTILKPVGFADMTLVAEAISSPQANEQRDYNRLEYLGDHVLKFCTALQVMAQHPMWPEAYLTLEKDRIVRNSNLAGAAVEAGLDAYILTKPFTGAKWRPMYVGDYLGSSNMKQREVSSKILADVVEALIGAAFVEGGLPMAYRCIQTLLPHETFTDQSASLTSLQNAASLGTAANLTRLEDLIGHMFTHPSLLLEALTHASTRNTNTGTSYERLEFLGDAILDLLITPKLFAHPRKLRHWQLHHVHEALVNSHILGHACMAYSTEVETFDIVPSASKNAELTTERSTRHIHLHDFLHFGPQLLPHKSASLEAYKRHRASIHEALASSSEYPWLGLLALSPRKFFSDLIESILGALYVDTCGDLSVCETFINKLGLSQLMQRLLDEEVETTHPKEVLGVMAGRDTVVYESCVVKNESDRDGKGWLCVVRVGGEAVASIGGCGGREEAEARAAWEAMGILRGRMREGGVKSKRDFDGVGKVGMDVGAGTMEGEEEGGDGDEVMLDA